MAADISVIAPIVRDGETLFQLPGIDLYYAVFAKKGGRNPSELSIDQYEQIGRLIARMHNVGSSKNSEHRLRLDCNTFGSQHLDYLYENNVLPSEIENDYIQTVETLIFNIRRSVFKSSSSQNSWRCSYG